MSKSTSITLGPHLEKFIAKQIKSGRYGSVSEAIRAALRLLEEHETQLETLRLALQEGEESGRAEYSLEGLINELNQE